MSAMIKKNETPEQRQKRLAYNRAWHKKNRNEENRKRKSRYYGWQRDSQINEYRIKRLEVLKRMGEKCLFCGETDEPVLTIDHVLNDGAQERKTSNNIYLQLHKMTVIPKERYQILCLNCNHKKRIFGSDYKNWPQKRTVNDQLDTIRVSFIPMSKAREANRNGQTKKDSVRRDP